MTRGTRSIGRGFGMAVYANGDVARVGSGDGFYGGDSCYLCPPRDSCPVCAQWRLRAREAARKFGLPS